MLFCAVVLGMCEWQLLHRTRQAGTDASYVCETQKSFSQCLGGRMCDARSKWECYDRLELVPKIAVGEASVLYPRKKR
jgi:hypothetical protein